MAYPYACTYGKLLPILALAALTATLNPVKFGASGGIA